MLEIKELEKNELQQVQDISNIIWKEHYVAIIGEDQVNYMLDKFLRIDVMEKQIEEEGYHYYGFYENNTFVGYMALVFQEETFLSKLYLLANTRGKGYAREAITFAVNESKKRNLTSICLTCNKDNINSIAAYKKLGFEIYNSGVQDIGNGYVMDDYYMRKVLV